MEKKRINKKQGNLGKHCKQEITIRYRNQIQTTLTNAFEKIKNKKANLTKKSTQNPTKTRYSHVKKQDCNTHNKGYTGPTETVVNQQVKSYRNNRDPEVYYDTKCHM